ncbi:DUF4184 family protein [Microbacterium sp. P01]|uniref:DUF4184 family protein n=1 Tax=Microbacterium sp. P01 TaxID=3366261 RepID=UPI00366DC82A
MPFTPSHAVVALLFVRTPLVPAAIAVGAMAPDLPLFVRGTPVTYGGTHDLAQLPSTILVALLLLLTWRMVLRPAARELAPRMLAERLPVRWDGGAATGWRETFAVAGSPRRASFVGVVLLVTSLALGILTHVVWDLFTHEGRWGSEMLPVLDEEWGPFTGYKWLQHGSSVLGLVILAVCALIWWRRADTTSVPPRRNAERGIVDRALPGWTRGAWWVSLPAILVSGWIWGMVAFGPFSAEWTIPHLAYRVLPPACALWGCLTIVVCIAVQVARSARRGASATAVGNE